MIKLIAAVGRNRELGKQDSLIWHLKGDMAFFKTQTMRHTVVMGATTFKSLPKKLVNRTHYVLTKGSVQDTGNDDVMIFTRLGKLMEEVKEKSKTEDVYIIGGGTVYALFIDLADEILLTEIDAEEKRADVFFPKFDREKYTRHVLASNEENGIRYTHVRYTRI